MIVNWNKLDAYSFIVSIIWLFRYNIHDGDQFHVDLKPDSSKPHASTRPGRKFKKELIKLATQNLFFLLLVDIKNSSNQNQELSSASSENDRKSIPFSFDSLQNLPNQTDLNTAEKFIQLDQFYPSNDKNLQMKNTNEDDDDDDLLSAAAIACTQINK